MVVLLSLQGGWALAAPPAPAACPAADEPELSSGELPHLAAALKPAGELDVLAVGAGPARDPAAMPAPAHPNGFLSQFGHALEAGLHGLHVNITLQGGGGLEASQQLVIIRDAVKRHRYQLVLWQTGTVEAVNDDPADDFYQALTDGADAVSAAGADLVLIEPQYSRFLEGNANMAPYLSVMQSVSTLPGILLFHRYELMRGWVEGGLIDLESAAAADRPAVAARLRACLGAELARTLLADATGTAD
jgi:hypothetical protein